MIPKVTRAVREIPVGLIDDPELAMRDTFAGPEFDELKASIATNGIRVALIVVKRGERYRLVAGHRRLCAARELRAVTVPCDVQEIPDDDLEFVKVLENEDRQEVNAGDAAVYFMRLFRERCGEDVDRLCAMVRRNRRYVEDRLLLFSGDEEVFNALKAGRISFGVAKELNQILDVGYRRLHLDNALKYGMTIAAAQENRKAANFAVEQGAKQPIAQPVDESSSAAAAPSPYVCYICGRSDHVERMRYMMVHEHCDLAIGQRVLAGFKEPDAEPVKADA